MRARTRARKLMRSAERGAMRIGELADRTAVSIRSLRYYEEQGLLPPERNDGGRRTYTQYAVE
ncbi:hypothetical protein GCM10022223_32520 [Kineosporia mesophila]|uniref:HTH merR-type domain-containing protein n=1 Tax=Kineosporia mesophila TaxID=566012 RepID=A0ABP6ZQZ5_9ACTN